MDSVDLAIGSTIEYKNSSHRGATCNQYSPFIASILQGSNSNKLAN